MTFNDALKKLNISDYGARIYDSNSHGELMHLYDYIEIAESIKNPSWFREWFESLVIHAEEQWKRPESIFQHIQKCLENSFPRDNKTPK